MLRALKMLLRFLAVIFLSFFIRAINSPKLAKFSPKYRLELAEAKRILKELDRGLVKKILIAYDTSASPPTYGDYIFVVMFARYFVSQGLHVDLIIIDRERRPDWASLNTEKAKSLISDYMEIAKTLLDQGLSSAEILTFEDFQLRAQEAESPSVYIPFGLQALARKPIYSHMLNTLNVLCKDLSADELDRFLLSLDDFLGKIDFNTPDIPYITWHCRYSELWGLERNTGEEEFLATYFRLKELNPDHSVMIVSDTVGCDYYRGLADKNKIECLFSKDYSDTLLGDGGLVLNSDYFFMLRGGGMAVIPMFSRLPHERVVFCSNELEWSPGRATSWATEYQMYRRPDQEESLWPTISLKR